MASDRRYRCRLFRGDPLSHYGTGDAAMDVELTEHMIDHDNVTDQPACPSRRRRSRDGDGCHHPMVHVLLADDGTVTAQNNTSITARTYAVCDADDIKYALLSQF